MAGGDSIGQGDANSWINISRLLANVNRVLERYGQSVRKPATSKPAEKRKPKLKSKRRPTR